MENGIKNPTASENWNVTYFLFYNSSRPDLIPCASPSDLTFQNLYYDKDGTITPVKITLSSGASGSTWLNVTNDLTFKMGSYGSKVVFANSSDSKIYGYIGVGKNINVGTADQADGVSGKLQMGVSKNAIKELNVGGSVNVRKGGTFELYTKKYTSGKITLDDNSNFYVGDSSTYADTLTANGYSSTGTAFSSIYAKSINITDTITLSNTDISKRTTIRSNAIATKDIVASDNGWLYVFATNDASENSSFNVNGDITLSNNAKLLSQNMKNFGTNDIRANITLNDTSLLSFGFTTNEASLRNVYTGVITLNGQSTGSRPTFYLNNITERSDSHATWDVKGIQGAQGNISLYVPGTNNTANLILNLDEGATYTYSGALQNINILMTDTSNKGTQYLRGNNRVINTVSIGGGTLYLNGKNLTSAKIAFENSFGTLGIVSETSDYGEINAREFYLNQRSTLLFDISDSAQDIITAKTVGISKAEVNGEMKTFHIDFTLADDVVLGKEYIIFEAETINNNDNAFDLITSTNNLGYDAEFILGSNSLSVIFTSVPEPAEWAMIFGAIALGFAIYRRRK